MLQSSNDVIVRIEPIDIEMLEATATHETERFLFFFFKRDKVTYQVKLNVTIELTKIVVENIAFKERQKNVYQNFSLRKRKQKQEIT
ncbi:hypothetical protein BCAMP_00800 [Brochothrix campestris FSL F6-1037]|uniref:Uncharacterized protein n=2 Tax=Brochothrix campestris TaxID=2757 RepID=W7CR59_9LIST|nr:hypothetical protein BCAMP_00800 [Brochothrix campestris FSL F6-1037]